MSYTIDKIAEVAHEANRALQYVNDDPSVPVSPAWPSLDPETRQSIREGVQGILDGATPRESHEAWCAFKRAHGWSHGPVKDLTAKTHPCLLPYDELREADRIKDTLFAAIVTALKGGGSDA